MLSVLFSYPKFYGGSKHLEPALQLPPSPSMHHTHFRLGGYGGQEVADPSFKKTDYAQTYIPKDIIPVSTLANVSGSTYVLQIYGLLQIGHEVAVPSHSKDFMHIKKLIMEHKILKMHKYVCKRYMKQV